MQNCAGATCKGFAITTFNVYAYKYLKYSRDTSWLWLTAVCQHVPHASHMPRACAGADRHIAHACTHFQLHNILTGLRILGGFACISASVQSHTHIACV